MLQRILIISLPVAALAYSAPVKAQDIGIASCDSFLKTYSSCIAGSVPAAQQGQMKQVMEQMKANWRAVAADAKGRSELDTVCKQTTETMKQQTASLGCKW
jgi:hypothetical protein